MASAIGAVITLLFGVLCDKIGVLKTVVAFGILCVIGRIVPVVVGGTIGAIIMAVLNGTMAFSTMFIGVGFPLVVGFKNLGTIAGWAGSLMSAGG